MVLRSTTTSKMQKYIAVVTVLSLTSCVAALRCMVCYASKSFEECDVSGHLQECNPNQGSCETVVRRYNSNLWVTKGCKDTNACGNNELQNSRISGKSTQCNSNQPTSICTCCCTGSDFCNAGRPDCVNFYPGLNDAAECPLTTTKFPHGKIKCYKKNKVCRYECTEDDYVIWPAGRVTNICLDNGTWAYEKPCCARPCPPYYLVDDLKLIHFERENAERRLHNFFDTFVYGVISEESLKHAVMYFNVDPVESSLVNFNEYGENATLYMELVRERVKINNTGGANLGKAIRYALKNIFTTESGMRYEKVPKMIGIMTNVNPDDDAITAAEEAKKRGYRLYVVGLELDGDFKFDREKLTELTGDPSLVYIFDQEYGETFQHHHFDGMDLGTCPNPCDHVMHTHT